MRAWESLQNESSLISRGLEEARGILDFNNEVSKVSSDIVVELPDLRICFQGGSLDPREGAVGEPGRPGEGL